MVRNAFMGVGLVVCLLVATASIGLAERIEVQVYENTDPNNPLEKTRLLEGVEVTLWRVIAPGDRQPVDSAVTDADGNVVFENVGEEAPGETRMYEVSLETLATYVPVPLPGQSPQEAAAGLPFKTTSVFQTTQPSPTPMPMVDRETPQDPPRNGEKPSSGGIPTMGVGGTQRVEFPVGRSEPEDGTETFQGFIQGLVFRDVGNSDGVFVNGVDERVQGANVEIEYRDPVLPTSSFTTPANGTFFDFLKQLQTKVDGTPPDVFVRVRASPQDPWSQFRQIPITLDPITGDLKYLRTSTQFNVGSVAPSGSIAGQVIQDDAPGNGAVDPGELGVQGETVELRNASFDTLLSSTTSGVGGDFSFGDLPAGTYKVMVPGVVMRVVVVGADEAVTGQDLVLPHVPVNGSIAGQVVQDDAPGNGQVDPGESGVAGQPVELRDANTDALVDSTNSGATGAYQFADVAPGDYKVMVPGVVMRTVTVGSGEDVTGQDLVLPFIAPSGSIAGRVVQDEAPGNGQADPGESGVADKTVELRDAGSNALLGTRVSGAGGAFLFDGLSAGTYRVMVPGEAMRTVAVANDQAVTGVDLVLPVDDNGGPDNCVADNCEYGALHEVLLETEMWIGATPSGFDVRATLRENCSGNSPAVDTVQLAYQGTTFPGSAQGLDEVLTIEDVSMQPGAAWATVRLRVTAAPGAFADGSFGNVSRRLELAVNGRSSLVCWRFRCETTRVGGRVGLCRVLGTLSRDAWAACTGFQVPPGTPTPPVSHPPVSKPPCKPVACAPCTPKPKVCKPKVWKPKTKSWKSKSWKSKNWKAKTKKKRYGKKRRSWAKWCRR